MTRKTEATELCTPRLKIEFREFFAEQALEIFNRAFVVWELISRVLRIFGEFEGGMFRNGAFAWVENASDEMKKGGFPCSVSPQNSDAGVHAIE
jgi:hypothetical protein